jgi:DNA-binding HxlR family transcriptional regulator
MFLEAQHHSVTMKTLLLHLQELVIKEILVHKVFREHKVLKEDKVLKVFRVKQEHL